MNTLKQIIYDIETLLQSVVWAIVLFIVLSGYAHAQDRYCQKQHPTLKDWSRSLRIDFGFIKAIDNEKKIIRYTFIPEKYLVDTTIEELTMASDGWFDPTIFGSKKMFVIVYCETHH